LFIGRFQAYVPSGASTGAYEAVELRDNDKSVHHGKGVTKAIKNVNEKIAPALIAKNFQVTQQAEIDKFLIDLDNTANKGFILIKIKHYIIGLFKESWEQMQFSEVYSIIYLKSNNIYCLVSLAVCKAGAVEKGLPLYKYIAELANVKKVCSA